MVQPEYIVLSGTSASGKSTLCERLTTEHANLNRPVTVTNREPRPGEVDGVDYHFVSMLEFHRMVAKEEFLEWAVVSGQLKGTPKGSLETIRRDDGIPILVLDRQGLCHMKEIYGDEKVLGIFLCPPSMGHIEQRLRDRDTDISEEELRERLKDGYDDISWAMSADEVDAVVVSREGEIEATYDTLDGLIRPALRPGNKPPVVPRETP